MNFVLLYSTIFLIIELHVICNSLMKFYLLHEVIYNLLVLIMTMDKKNEFAKRKNSTSF